MSELQRGQPVKVRSWKGAATWYLYNRTVHAIVCQPSPHCANW